jgi:hypothetical protein
MNLIIAAVIVVGGWWLIRQFANAQPAQVRGMVRKAAGAAVIAFAGFMALRGGMNIAAPLFVLGLGLLGQNAAFPGGFPWQKKSAGQSSRVATAILSMELDHDSGSMDGTVLDGGLKGRRLSGLSMDELKRLHQDCTAAGDKSAALLEAWLDRSRAGWREAWGEPQRKAASTGSGMTRKEALAILGLQEGADAEQVRAAHRRLMKDFHPDKGGSDYLAAKINEAKELLLQDAGATT